MSKDAMKRARDLADAWQEQKRLSDEQQSINTHFDRATPHQLITMWDTGLNLAGTKLSSFELSALIEQWCKVFGSLPPNDEDLEAMDAEPVTGQELLPADDTMLDMQTVVRVTGVSKSTIKRMVISGQFPKPIRLSPRRQGWPAKEVKAWLSALDDQRKRTRH